MSTLSLRLTFNCYKLNDRYSSYIEYVTIIMYNCLNHYLRLILLKINFFTQINNELVHELYNFSVLMEDANELKRIVFTIGYHILAQKQGSFFIGYHKNKKVSYGLLSNGTQDLNFRRLKYFAVIRKYRNKNIGRTFICAIDTIKNIQILKRGVGENRPPFTD